MSIAINRNTKKILNNIYTGFLNPVEWLINPDLSAVSNLKQKYWKLVGDSVVAMNDTEKAQADIDELNDIKNIKINKVVKEIEAFFKTRYSGSTQLSMTVLFFEALNNGLNNRANYLGQALVYSKNVLTVSAETRVIINNCTTKDQIKLVEVDYDALIASDPMVSVATALTIMD